MYTTVECRRFVDGFWMEHECLRVSIARLHETRLHCVGRVPVKKLRVSRVQHRQQQWPPCALSVFFRTANYVKLRLTALKLITISLVIHLACACVCVCFLLSLSLKITQVRWLIAGRRPVISRFPAVLSATKLRPDYHARAASATNV